MILRLYRYAEHPYDAAWALLGAGTAGDTLVVVYPCKVAFHSYRTLLAGLHAECAAYAACRADVHNRLTLFRVGALYPEFLVSRNELDDVLRAGLDAGLAGRTLGLIDLCNAVYDMDGVELAGLDAGSVSKTSIEAGLVACSRNRRKSVTVVRACIEISLRSLLTGSGASYECNHLFLFSGLNAHYLGYFIPYRLLSYRTCGYRSSSFIYGLGASVTSWISAASAVIAWEYFADGGLSLIDLDLELLSEYAESESNDDADYTNKHRSNDYRSNIHLRILLYISPAKPKNAIDMSDAVMITIGTP